MLSTALKVHSFILYYFKVEFLKAISSKFPRKKGAEGSFLLTRKSMWTHSCPIGVAGLA